MFRRVRQLHAVTLLSATVFLLQTVAMATPRCGCERPEHAPGACCRRASGGESGEVTGKSCCGRAASACRLSTDGENSRAIDSQPSDTPRAGACQCGGPREPVPPVPSETRGNSGPDEDAVFSGSPEFDQEAVERDGREPVALAVFLPSRQLLPWLCVWRN